MYFGNLLLDLSLICLTADDLPLGIPETLNFC